MRTFFTFILLTTILSCTKDKANSSSLDGNWMWTHSYSGWGGNEESSSQHYQELKPSDGNHYQWLINGSIEAEGEYSFSIEHSIFTGNDESMLNLNGMLESPFVIQQSGNDLELSQNAPDGTTYYFTK